MTMYYVWEAFFPNRTHELWCWQWLVPIQLIPSLRLGKGKHCKLIHNWILHRYQNIYFWYFTVFKFPDVLYILLYLYNIYKELTEDSRVLTSIECGILLRLFDFYFSILHNFVWILSCIAWKVFLKTKTILCSWLKFTLA